jgi:hypothetical protein
MTVMADLTKCGWIAEVAGTKFERHRPSARWADGLTMWTRRYKYLNNNRIYKGPLPFPAARKRFPAEILCPLVNKESFGFNFVQICTMVYDMEFSCFTLFWVCVTRPSRDNFGYGMWCLCVVRRRGDWYDRTNLKRDRQRRKRCWPRDPVDRRLEASTREG